MGLNIYLTKIMEVEVAEQGITHNVIPMAKLCGVYEAIWRGDEHDYEKAEQLIPVLIEGIAIAKARYDELVELNPSNGWGTASGFVWFLQKLLSDCKKFPDATLTFSR